MHDAIATFPVTLAAGKNYIVTASGIVGNAATPFTLIADDAARTVVSDPTKVDVSVLHGSPDAPAVDVEAVGVGNIITNLAYGNCTGYLSLDPGEYILRIKPAGTSTVVATFRAIDQNGRIIRTKILGSIPQGTIQERIELSDIQSGIYFLEVLSTNGIRTAKVTVQK